MNIKRSELKSEIKSIVKESIAERLNEVSPPGSKAERMIHHVKASLRKSHPDWDEEKIKSVAIATGWKSHNKGTVEEAGLTSENNSMSKIVKILEVMANMVEENPTLIKEKLLQMAEQIKSGQTVTEASYKVVSPNAVDVTDEDKARTIQTEPKVNEGHKVQARSYKTAEDGDQDPKNVQDPEVPMS